MRILAIESSAAAASAAILSDNIMTAEYTVNFKQTHSQTLLPMIDDICNMTGTPIESVDAIAVSSGPGSFTGLRIGSASAKGIGLALNKPIIEVPTLEGLAMNVYGTDRLVCPIMDARRSNVYTGIYEFDYDNGGFLNTLCGQELALIEEVLASAADMAKNTGKQLIFVGDAVSLYDDMIEEKLHSECIIAAPNNCMPHAGSVAARGAQLFSAGCCVSADRHVPDYLRPSQAERTREACSGNDNKSND